MRYDKLLESMNPKVTKNISVKRYNLSDMISESYRALYQTKEGTNLRKLAEAHLEDVRKNPTQIDRLSSQLCKLNAMTKLVESGKVKDQELLVPEESHDTVDPKEERALDLEEGKKSEEDGESLEEEARPYQWSTEWQKERGKLEKFKYYSTDMLLDSDEIVGVIVKDETDGDELYGAEIYDTTSMETIDGFNQEFDTEEDAKQWVENWFSSNEGKKCETTELNEVSNWDTEWYTEPGNPYRMKSCSIYSNQYVGTIYEPDGKDYDLYGAEIWDNHAADVLASAGFETEEEAKQWVDDWMAKKYEETGNPMRESEESDDLELTDEEKEELAKHLANIRKDKKMSECDTKKSVRESKGRKLMRRSVKESADEEIVDCKESKSWSNVDLSEFSQKSANKAFTKTFKKLSSKLKEGTALTRSETMSLYKATNSAMTHLSVELEHNPGFLSTFNESVSLLQSDSSKILEGMKVNKAPSKATMKHLAKFVESLLNEGRDNLEDQVLDAYRHFTDDAGKTPDVSDVMEFLVTHYDISDSGYSDNSGIEAARLYSKIESILSDNGMEFVDESKEPLIEDEEADSIEEPVDAPEELSDEEEEFLQDYADAYAQARDEIHKELEDKYGDSEDPGVQERLAQDAEEVSILNGEEEPEEDPSDEGDEVEDNVVPDEDAEDLDEEDDSDLTDDELEALKKFLTEMRKSKKAQGDQELDEASEDPISTVKSALDDEGIEYTVRGRNKDILVVAKADLIKASLIRDEVDPEKVVTVSSRG